MHKAAKHVVTALTLILGIAGLTGCSHQTKQVAKATQQGNADVLTYRLEDLDNRVADHGSPDAMVFIAPHFDNKKPIHLIVYNHGMMTNLDDVEQGWKISQAMKSGAPNTVLVAPEWAVNPHDLSDKAGPFHKAGFFKSMLSEIFEKTPELKGKTINDVDSIALTSFSGGLYALVSELERNDLQNKVTTVAVFDSLYKSNALDGWLKNNIKDIASGKKQYYNFWFHTYPQSLAQLKRVKGWLASAKIQKAHMKVDLDNTAEVLPAERIAPRNIIFKATNYVQDPKFPGHPMVAKVYIPEFIKAQALRQTKGFDVLVQEEQKKSTKLTAGGPTHHLM